MVFEPHQYFALLRKTKKHCLKSRPGQGPGIILKMGENDTELDVKDFCFKQMCKLQVFNPPSELITDVVNFIVTSDKFGKIYVAAGKEIKAIDLTTIEVLTSKEDADITQTVSNFDHKILDTRKNIQHIGLSCDDLTLSVVFEENNSLWIGCLDVRYFEKSNSSECFFATGKLSSEPDVYLRELEWNPEDPDLAIVCLSDGKVSLIKIVNQSVNIVASLPSDMKFSSVNWSPRGKNFASGQDDGRIMLYDKKLTLKKELPCPEDLRPAKHKVAKVRWIMSHNFAAVYLNADEDEPSKFICIVTQKEGPTAYMNMEDVYFGYSEERKLSFYMETIPAWNMIVTMASNAFEGVVIGKVDNKWMRWALDDDGRAEMPLTEDRDETFPCGIGISLNSTSTITEGEATLPPTPIFLMISTHGVLCPYHMVNKRQGVNHQILMKQNVMSLDGMRMPLASEKQNAGQQKESPTGNIGSLPKPFMTSTFASSSGLALTKEQPRPSLSTQPMPFALLSTSASSLAAPTTVAGLSGFAFTTGLSSVSTGNANKEMISSVPFSTGKTASAIFPSSSQASENKPISLSNKENEARLQSIAPAKPLAFGSSSSLFASPSGLGTSVFGVSTAVSTSSQQNVSAKAHDAQTSSKASIFATPPQPTHPGPMFSGFAQTFASPKTTALSSALSAAAVTSSSVSIANANLVNRSDPAGTQQAKTSVEKKENGAQGQVPAGRVPPESRLLQSAMVTKPVQEKVQQKLPQEQPKMQEQQEPTLQKPKSISSEDAKKMPVVKEMSKIEKMSKELGSEIRKSIEEEITSFTRELQEFKHGTSEFQTIVGGVGTNEEKAALRKSVNNCIKTLKGFQECQKEHRSECSQLKSKMLKSFDAFEQARIHHAGVNDPRYKSLLKTRALDPVASRQRKELRSQINYLTALISDVNESLDIAMDQDKMNAYKKQKSVKTNNIHNIYITMESIDKVINNLASKVDSLSLKAEEEELMSRPFSFRKSFLRESQLTESEERLTIKENSNSVSIGKLRLSPMKQSQLKSIIKKRGAAPVIKSAYKDPSLLVKPRAASTPAVNPSARKIFDFQAETPPANVRLETLNESTIEKDRQSHEEKSKGITEKKGISFSSFATKPIQQHVSMKPTPDVPRTEPSMVFGMKGKPYDEKPAAQFGFAFQQSSENSQERMLPFGITAAATKVDNKVINQSSSITPKVSSSQSPPSFHANTFDLKGEGESITFDSNISKKETNGDNVASISMSAAFATSTMRNPLPTAAAIPAASAERKADLSKPFSVVVSKPSPFAANFQPTSLFGTGASSGGVNVGIGNIPTSSTLSGQTASAKPSVPTTGGPISFFGASDVGSSKFQSGSNLSSASLSTPLATQISQDSKTEKKPTDGVDSAATQKPTETTSNNFASANEKTATFKLSASQALTSTKEPFTGNKPIWAPALSTGSFLFGNTSDAAKPFATTPPSTALFGTITTTTPLSSVKTATTLSTAVTENQGFFGKPETTTKATVAVEPKLTETLSPATASSTSVITSKFGAVTSDTTSTTTTSTSSTSSTSTATSLFDGQTIPAIPAVSSSNFIGAGSTSTLFGGQTTGPVATLSAFNIKTTEGPTNLFGTKPVSSSAFGTQPSLFGTKMTESSTGLFGTAASAPKSSIFSVPYSSSAQTTESFGSKASENTSGLFGAATGNVTSSLFGSSTQSTSVSSGFVGTTSASSSKPSIFGAQTAPLTSTLFGQTASSGATLFGNQQSTGLFGSKPAEVQSTGLFRTPAASQSSGGLFGSKGATSTGGVFGTTTTSQTAFGQAPSAFGSQQTTSGMGFGGFGLGGKPTNNPNKNPFGSVPSTSSTPSTSGGSSGLFGSTSAASPFAVSQASPQSAKGTFSKGFGSGFMGSSASTQSAFGSTSAGTASFGGGATFGGAPTFGGTPAFGGSSTFGSTSAFGASPSAGSAFGSGSSSFGQSTGFGALAQQTSPSFSALGTQGGGQAFGGLASNQNQMGFGDLSQQSNTFGQSGSAFGQSGSAFGQSKSPQGSSFTSWR